MVLRSLRDGLGFELWGFVLVESILKFLDWVDAECCVCLSLRFHLLDM